MTKASEGINLDVSSKRTGFYKEGKYECLNLNNYTLFSKLSSVKSDSVVHEKVNAMPVQRVFNS